MKVSAFQKVSDYIIQFLADEGAKHVFLLPGGGCMHLVDSVGKSKRVKFTCMLHEQAAAIAADGYAQFTGGLGVCLVTTGPGSTNATTGVYGAWCESTPLLVLSGQVKTKDIKDEPDMRMLGFQEVDIVSMVKPITKYAVTITHPGSVRFHLEKAVHEAMSGRRGPVWLNVPLDLQSAEIEPEKLNGFEVPRTPLATNDKLKADVQKILGTLREAKRPVILAGNGITLAGAREVFKQTVEMLGVPVLLTYKAADLLPAEHPLNFGRPGVIALRGPNFIQQNADLIICIGARLDKGQIGFAPEQFAPRAKKIVVDCDWMELFKHKFKAESICADAWEFLDELADHLEGPTGLQTPWEWIVRCKDYRDKYPAVTAAMRAQKNFVSTYVLMEELSKQMTGKDILVPGSSGGCSEVACQTFQVKEGQRFINSPSIGAMGFGLPQAIGVAIASGRRVICVNGDGGFQMNIQELETVQRLNLPIKFFILNNGGYASMRNTHRNYFKRVVAADVKSGLTLPSVSCQAAALGMASGKVFNHQQLSRTIEFAFKQDGPVVIEVYVDPDEQVQPRAKSVLRADGTSETKPFEDMWPFLSRKELAANMIL